MSRPPDPLDDDAAGLDNPYSNGARRPLLGSLAGRYRRPLSAASACVLITAVGVGAVANSCSSAPQPGTSSPASSPR